MKKYILAVFLLASAAMVVFYSCKKQVYTDAAYQVTDSVHAYLKIIHASVNFRALTGKQDTFNVYLNKARLTPPTTPTSAALSYGSVFPGTASNAYMAVEAGVDTLRLSIPGVVNTDSVTILTLYKYLAPGKYYTFIITDSLLAGRDSSKIFVQDLYAPPVVSYINLRFIHAVINDTAGKTVDLWSYARNAAIITKVKPDSVSSFLLAGVNPSVPDTLYVRRTGTTLNLAKLLFAPTPQRTYTLYYYGDGNLTTGKKARTLANYGH